MRSLFLLDVRDEDTEDEIADAILAELDLPLEKVEIAGKEGHWVTIRGNPVFILEGKGKDKAPAKEGTPYGGKEANFPRSRLKELLPEINEWDNKEAQYIAALAIASEDNPNAKTVTYRDENGRLQGILQTYDFSSPKPWEIDADGNPRYKSVEVGYVATNMKGVGTRLMKRAMKIALKKNVDLTLSAVKAAEGFYEHLGMRRQAPKSSIFEMTPAELKRALKRMG